MEESYKRQYFERLRYRYQVSSRKDKGRLLVEVQELLGCHRKHAIRLMKRRKAGRKASGRKRGRKFELN